MTTTRITDASSEALTATEVKLHARIDTSADDAIVTRLIAAARLECEAELQRTIMPVTWLKTLDYFPARGIDLLYPTVTAITHVKYYDGSGTLITLDSSAYQLDTYSKPAILAPAPGTLWPSTQLERMNAVQITYTAGWADAAAVPTPIKQWMLIRIAQLYEHREEVAAGFSVALMPHVDRLLDGFRVVKV